jgi:hypothetical protein
MKAYPEMETWNEDEEDRLENIRMYVFVAERVILLTTDNIIVPKQEERAPQRRSGRKKVRVIDFLVIDQC